jgi:hypothetical protein
MPCRRLADLDHFVILREASLKSTGAGV